MTVIIHPGMSPHRYINYGAFSMNYLLESKELARFTDPDKIDTYDGIISSIQAIMNLLTVSLLVTFAAVGLTKGKKYALRAKDKMDRFRHTESTESGRLADLDGGGTSPSLPSILSSFRSMFGRAIGNGGSGGGGGGGGSDPSGQVGGSVQMTNVNPMLQRQ